MSSMAGPLSALSRAWSTEIPAPVCPGGPWINPWWRTGAEPVEIPAALADLLNGLWRDLGVHRRPDGTPTGITRRPVPSAGASYPVQTHLVVGADEALPSGRYFFDHQSGLLLRRPGSGPSGAGCRVLFTVQPGRSFGRYRHRAWPLWIADTAYALAALEFLIGPLAADQVQLGPGEVLREVLRFPAAAATDRWLELGLVPEIALAMVTLPHRFRVDPVRRDALFRRRSPAVAEFERTPAGRRHPGARAVATAAEQAWVAGAVALRTWSIPIDVDWYRVGAQLWQSHRRAAGCCYLGSAGRSWRYRPISGFVAGDRMWLCHALAGLPWRPDPEWPT